MWSPAGSQGVYPVVGAICSCGPGVWGCSAAVGLWAGQPATELGAYPPQVSGVSAQPGLQLWAPSLLIWVQARQASGECWGCLSCVHSPGAEGGGAPEARAAAESSLTSRKCLYFLFEKFFLFKPPWSKQAPGLSHSPAWLSPENTAGDPVPRPGASAALVPALVPGTLLSLSTLLTV